MYYEIVYYIVGRIESKPKISNISTNYTAQIKYIAEHDLQSELLYQKKKTPQKLVVRFIYAYIKLN